MKPTSTTAMPDISDDAPIVEHFTALSGESGYQTLINDTLRRAVAGESLEADLRDIIHEELDALTQSKPIAWFLPFLAGPP